MSGPIPIRDAAVTAIKALSGLHLKSVEPHDGTIDVEAVRRWFKTHMSVRVAVLGAAGVSPVGNGQFEARWKMAAYIVTKDATTGCTVAMDIAVRVIDETWGAADALAASDLRIENLHTSAMDKLGGTLWSVSWIQPIRHGQDMFAETGVRTDILASQAPNIGATNKTKYTPVGGGSV